MKVLLSVGLALGLVAAASATVADMDAAQEAADAFYAAITDDDFDAFLERVSAKRAAEYEKNNENCPIARWWETGRELVDEDGATWEYKDYGSDTKAQVVLNYTRTIGEESKIVRCTLVKEEDKWLVYAGSP